MEEIYARYGNEVTFYVVYIREAHPFDEWQVPVNETAGVVFEQPTTEEERAAAASSCAIGLNLSIPTLIDEMSNAVDEAYAALPDRLYLVDAAGRVAYRSEPGPFGFKSDEFEAAIVAHLKSTAVAPST